MANYLTTDTDLTSVANAIRAKGGTSAALTYPAGFVSAIDAIPTGGGGSSDVNVIFIDYDGTVVDTKTKAQINAMTSDADLPSNPSHTGLVSQGWNWTVAQLKTQLTAMPNQKVYVGQMYVTESGDTEIDVEMPEGRLSPIMTIAVQGTITVDWGDNTTPDTVTGTSVTSRKAVGPHNYAAPGSYTIKISVSTGKFSFYCTSSYILLRKNTTADQNRVYASCIKRVRVGTGMEKIDTYAFYGCYSLTSITIPSGITSIGSNAFVNCYSLRNITIPNTATSIKTSAFYGCYSLTSITIPNSVTSIETSAFTNCYSLSSVTIPNSVTSIGNAFSNCYSLTSITIPNNVTSIGSAFFYCYSLSNITIPNGVTKIETNAFYYCYSLSNITIPDSITSIGTYAFYNCCSLASITIPNTVTSIGNNAFYYCYSLSNITIPDSVISIGDSAFANCYALHNITIPNTTTNIKTSTFYNCYSLTSITIPSSVTSIETSAFYSCYSLTSITIPSGVTSIGNNAFYYCYSLSNITIPDSVTSIGDSAFQGCFGASEIHILPEIVPTLGTNAFSAISSDCIIYVPYSADHSILNAYQAATNWSTYASKIQEEPT